MNVLSILRKGCSCNKSQSSSLGESEVTLSSTGVSARYGPGVVIIGRGEYHFRTQVPDKIKSGEEFQVYEDGRVLRVKCSSSASPGTCLQITVPVNYYQNYNVNSGGILDFQDSPKISLSPGFPHLVHVDYQVPDKIQPGEEFQVYQDGQVFRVKCPSYVSPGTRQQTTFLVNNLSGFPSQEFFVSLRESIQGGQRFQVRYQGNIFWVTCPNQYRAGMYLRIVHPFAQNNMNNSPCRRLEKTDKSSQKIPLETKMFEVMAPKPGQPFVLQAEGVRILVNYPLDASTDRKIRFHLPIGIVSEKNNQGTSDLGDVQLTHDKDVWMRTIRVSDMKFQWIRVNDEGDIDSNKHFHHDRSAYVRKLEIVSEGHDSKGDVCISLIPASEALVDSKIHCIDGREVVKCGDVVQTQLKSFEEKVEWFQKTCSNLQQTLIDFCLYDEHLKFNLRREYVLSDSMEAVMHLGPNDMHRTWKMEFIGELGICHQEREWFDLLNYEIFNPDFGLWKPSTRNQMTMQINPDSETSCQEDHLKCFRFCGRVLGKALFDGHFVGRYYLDRFLFKHILGWPVTFAGLELDDEEYYKSLKQLTKLEDMEMVCVDSIGERNTIPVHNQSKISLNKDELPEYLESCLKYRMLGRVEQQLKQLLLGFYDVIPETLLTIFDFQELEFFMCGLPEIAMEDWIEHTEYSGVFQCIGPSHEVCIWFWEVVNAFDQEMKARLLNFVTGTSSIHSLGFCALQGSDGNIRRFTIHGVDRGDCFSPEAHPHLNRIDLSVYNSKKDLKNQLTIAIVDYASGFCFQ